jgi:hypothetical protein
MTSIKIIEIGRLYPPEIKINLSQKKNLFGVDIIKIGVYTLINIKRGEIES